MVFFFSNFKLLQSQASSVNRKHYLIYWTSSWHLLLHIQATAVHGNVFSVVCLSAVILYAFAALTVIVVLSKVSLIASNVFNDKMVIKGLTIDYS